MLKKKLLTLACVLGILGFGACFGGGGDYNPPPPPPLHIDLTGVRSIRVQVRNLSGSNSVDAAILAQRVVSHINWRNNATGINAHIQKETKDEDAVLEIAILSETATPFLPPDPLGFERWSFTVRVSATLTRKNGQILWSESNPQYTQVKRLHTQNPVAAWQNGEIHDWATFTIGWKLVNDMFYGQ